MLTRAAITLLLVLAFATSGGAAEAESFRLRLISGHSSLERSDPRREQCADVAVPAGKPFSAGSRELGWSISGTLTATDAWLRFTGEVRIGTTSAWFESAPFIDGVLEPKDMIFSSVIVFFHLAVERI